MKLRAADYFQQYSITRIAPLALGATICATPIYAKIDEVIVTAEFREKSTMDTAMSISAYDQKLLNDLRMTQTLDVAAQAPNVQISYTTFGISSPRITIRGATSSDFGPNAAAPVTVYTDGVVIANTTTQGFAMVDTERVEILKGPQGTLYGRNATSGSVNFISAKPTEELTGYARLTGGRYDTMRIEAAVAGPLTENVGGRLAILSNQTDGWVTNVFDGSEGPEQEDLVVRGILQSDLSDDVSVMLKVQYAENDGDAYPQNNALSANALFPSIVNPAFGSGGRIVDNDFTNPPTELEAMEYILQVDWDLGNMALTSLTGFLEHERVYWNDPDGTNLPLFHEVFDHEQEQFSQELRLTSTTDGALSWIAGLYYLTDEIDAATVWEISGLVAGGADPGAAGGALVWDFNQEVESYAAFVQFDYEFSDKWSGGLGLRYTKDKVEIDHYGSLFTPFTRVDNFTLGDLRFQRDLTNPAAAVTLGDESWDDVTGSLSLQYRPNDETLIYANIGVGYKTGTFNLNTFNSGIVFPVDPEELTSYELGAKWESPNRTVVASAAVFYYDYENFQTFSIIDVPGVGLNQAISNAPEAEVVGAEIEIMYAPTERILFNFGASMADTELKELSEFAGVVDDFSGNQFPHAPEYSFNGLVQYTHPLSDTWNIIPQIDFNWRDKFYGDIPNTEVVFVPSLNENVRINAEDDWDVNIRLTLENEELGLAITAFVEDVAADKGDRLTEGPGLESVGSTFTKFERPRFYGLTVSYDF